ncbi:camphor resistance protein CrcB [Halomicrobium zhouii]|uniref:Fluoride-specific ion channel FluC n=1 Tax=Halomicrobium zhouii TaxID=767519 RepID=A0A1I6KYZ3_9EURY|nr:CrcB family protein [Halomicrobium zhouii]SFR96407.1 camphor resistance protein CrcB [Halomicrobium zhouii]
MNEAQVRAQVRPVALVAVGGVLGAVARHAVTVSLPSPTISVPSVVLGTLVVNVVGSFALGALLSDARLTTALSAETRLVVGTGFLASFTTYSTFAVETASLSPRLAVANVAGNYALGFLAVVLGQVVARWLS